MNKRGFLATLAAMYVAPFAVKADPSPIKADNILGKAWMRGKWQPIIGGKPDRGWEEVVLNREHLGSPPHEYDAYVEIRIGKWRQAVSVMGSADPVEVVQSMLNHGTLLSEWIKEELTYPDSVLHTIRAESKAAVYKDLAERSVRILPR